MNNEDKLHLHYAVLFISGVLLKVLLTYFTVHSSISFVTTTVRIGPINTEYVAMETTTGDGGTQPCSERPDNR